MIGLVLAELAVVEQLDALAQSSDFTLESLSKGFDFKLDVLLHAFSFRLGVQACSLHLFPRGVDLAEGSNNRTSGNSGTPPVSIRIFRALDFTLDALLEAPDLGLIAWSETFDFSLGAKSHALHLGDAVDEMASFILRALDLVLDDRLLGALGLAIVIPSDALDFTLEALSKLCDLADEIERGLSFGLSFVSGLEVLTDRMAELRGPPCFSICSLRNMQSTSFSLVKTRTSNAPTFFAARIIGLREGKSQSCIWLFSMHALI